MLLVLDPDFAGGEDAVAAGLAVERIGGTSTCWMPFLAWIDAFIRAAAAAAAAAGSAAKAFGPAFPVFAGLKGLLGASGLLLLRVSD